jgi:hypothetical protein
VRNIGLLADLACRGRFDYATAGLLDVTHIRFLPSGACGRCLRKTGFAIEALLHFLDPRYVGLVEPPSASPKTIQLPSLTTHRSDARRSARARNDAISSSGPRRAGERCTR